MAVKNKKNCTCKKNDLELSLIESEEKFRLLMELATVKRRSQRKR